MEAWFRPLGREMRARKDGVSDVRRAVRRVCAAGLALFLLWSATLLTLGPDMLAFVRAAWYA